MNALKSIYKIKMLDLQDLIESNIENLTKLTYYKIKDTNQYSIEIELDCGKEKESEIIKLPTDDELKINKILNILVRNKVTPTGLKDCVTEIIKMNMI